MQNCIILKNNTKQIHVSNTDAFIAVNSTNFTVDWASINNIYIDNCNIKLIDELSNKKRIVILNSVVNINKLYDCDIVEIYNSVVKINSIKNIKNTNFDFAKIKNK